MNRQSLEIDKIREKYPGRIPVFVAKAPTARDIPDIPKQKFLVPSNLAIGQFIYIIRRQMQLPPEKALFIFVNNTLPTSSTLMSELYANHKSSDGALRVIYTSENTFGFNSYSYSYSYSSSYSSLLHPPHLQHLQEQLLL